MRNLTLAQWKQEAVALARANGVTGSLTWVWHYAGKAKGDTSRNVRNGYFVQSTDKGATLWFVEWLQGYPLRVRRTPDMSWLILAKCQEDEPQIPGSRGQIPHPSQWGVTVRNSQGKEVS